MTPTPTTVSSSEDRGPMRLPRIRRYTVYFITIGVFVTGALWLFYHYFMRKEGPFGFQNNPLESLWQILHAGFSFASVWALGWLWTTHIMRGWNMRWRRWSGASLALLHREPRMAGMDRHRPLGHRPRGPGDLPAPLAFQVLAPSAGTRAVPLALAPQAPPGRAPLIYKALYRLDGGLRFLFLVFLRIR
jgi:hypothetical protein